MEIQISIINLHNWNIDFYDSFMITEHSYPLTDFQNSRIMEIHDTSDDSWWDSGLEWVPDLRERERVEQKYLQYVWVRVRVQAFDYYTSTSPSTSAGWWVRVRVGVPAHENF